MKITNSIVWDHRGRVAKGAKGQLEVRVTVERKSYYFGTGIKVHKSEFVAGQIINCPGAKELNERLGIIYSKVLAQVNACVDAGEPIDINDIRQNVWQTAENQSEEPTLISWIEEQLPLLGVTEGTLKHYRPLVTRLIEYGKMTRWQDVTIENIYNFEPFVWIAVYLSELVSTSEQSLQALMIIIDARIAEWFFFNTPSRLVAFAEMFLLTVQPCVKVV